jgi:hypothetical protein
LHGGILGNLIVAQVVKKCPSYYGNRRQVPYSLRRSLCCVKLIHPTSPYTCSTSRISNLILSSQLRLGLPMALFYLNFLIKIFFARYMPRSSQCPWPFHVTQMIIHIVKLPIIKMKISHWPSNSLVLCPQTQLTLTMAISGTYHRAVLPKVWGVYQHWYAKGFQRVNLCGRKKITKNCLLVGIKQRK